MSKISLIIQREYLSRVKKRSFIIMTILGPVLIAALMIVPVWLALKDVDIQNIEVIDDTYAFVDQIPDKSTVKFEFVNRDIAEAKANFYDEKYTAILYIPKNGYSAPSSIRLFHKKQPSNRTLQHINSAIESVFEKDKLREEFNISKADLDKIKTEIDVLSISLDETGEENEVMTDLSMGIGFASAFLIYLFIFLYGVQVMRGVIEEKTSRIVEVIISSVKPFQLMLGKIIGIALVGLTQFLLWVILTYSIITVLQSMIPPEMLQPPTEQVEAMDSIVPEGQKQMTTANSQNMISEAMNNIYSINFPLILSCFLFYFMGGYLLYGALFAAIGSAVDSESDTQQFMFPITIPLILAFVMAQMVIQNPDSSLSFWMSMIPFTSPIIMMVRIPFGVPAFEVILSMVILAASFVFTTWIAGKIYRTGILMYGKKVTYKELWKWLFYKI